MKRCTACFLLFSVISFIPTGCSSGTPVENGNEEIAVTYNDSIPHLSEERRKLTGTDIRLLKDIQYDKYLLDDEYPYKDTVRHFQWEKIKEGIAHIENEVSRGGSWGVLSNYKNMNGEAPTIEGFVRNDYRRVSDQFGVERYQSVPLYSAYGDTVLVRYGRDGWIVKVTGNDTIEMVRVTGVSMEGEYLVPNRYLKVWGDSICFDKVVAVDVTNQNISTLTRENGGWHILSMNPATTGTHRPPHAHETPTGIFAVQEKKEKMYYVKDGTSEIAGFAPYASRFTNGAYIHGVPVQYPNRNVIEYSPSLGTTPRSHMCVRNASSHSQFVYDWATVKESVVIVID
ncbi:L,D-transpeptidase [Proteiniphilum sp. UBA5375]|uniref:L,D-transpeptidase n=1 Tax=Proteiniphilum sp. UBA5375 TaxID=1947278 RepID=UPI00257C0D4D|nr:L,D-transpeptidase [Proteiniphilum sp. UBA5375]